MASLLARSVGELTDAEVQRLLEAGRHAMVGIPESWGVMGISAEERQNASESSPVVGRELRS